MYRARGAKRASGAGSSINVRAGWAKGGPAPAADQPASVLTARIATFVAVRCMPAASDARSLIGGAHVRVLAATTAASRALYSSSGMVSTAMLGYAWLCGESSDRLCCDRVCTILSQAAFVHTAATRCHYGLTARPSGLESLSTSTAEQPSMQSIGSAAALHALSVSRYSLSRQTVTTWFLLDLFPKASGNTMPYFVILVAS